MDEEGKGEKSALIMDSRVSPVFHSVSRQVQYLLDHNRLLINEINQNQESRLSEGLTWNVLLIRQLNTNIGKVVDLYATMSSNFSNVFENLQVNSDQANPVSRPVSNGRSSAPGAAASQAGQNLQKKLWSADLP